MGPVRFEPDHDLPPIPFTLDVCHKAAELKQAGLGWKPHLGCFVWDRDKHIRVESPYPNQIYFILSLHRFLRIFASMDAMAERLIRLPARHQGLLLLMNCPCMTFKVITMIHWQALRLLNKGAPFHVQSAPLAHSVSVDADSSIF